MKSYDYIIVGAGSAGCVLANRLSADPQNSVLLLEAGGRDRNPLISIPLMAGVLYGMGSVNWGYATEPEPHLDGRRMPWPRGRVLGGSSSINGMMYARGLASDYDDWEINGWRYAELLPYFLRSEGHTGRNGPFHAIDGPMAASTASADNPLYGAFLEAGRQAGYPSTTDFNGPEPEGFGRSDFTIRDGRRESSATAFLRPVETRQNLRIETRALVRKVLIENARAIGVETESGPYMARQEVVIAAGTINSPKLLMLSGIGPGTALRDLGIEVVADLPGIGRNLQDHLGAYAQYQCLEPVTLFGLFRPDRMIAALLSAKFRGTGPAAAMPIEVGACIRSDASSERPDRPDQPDLKISIIPGLTLEASRRGQGRHGFLISVYGMRPKSRGRITLASGDPAEPPRIAPNYLSDDSDRVLLRNGLKIARRLVAQSAFDRYRGPEIAPGPAVASDAEIDRWIASNARTVFHPVGTCRMGEGPDAGVTADLRVRGVTALRVADASIMPALTSGNTHAPTVMIAEKAADLILGKPAPAAMTIPELREAAA